MSILVNKDTRLLVQGMTGREGLFHTQQMIAYGTKVVAGVTPGKGGEWVQGVPVFDTVRAAVESTGANCAISFVPARFAPDSMYEAADAGIPLLVAISENIPVQDMMKVRAYLDQRRGRLIGPNCPGLLTPGRRRRPASAWDMPAPSSGAARAWPKTKSRRCRPPTCAWRAIPKRSPICCPDRSQAVISE